MTADAPVVAPLAFDINEAVEEVWIRAEALHARSWQQAPGPSDAGTCQRRVGYMYAGTPPSDPLELSSPAATLGSWIHDRFLPLLQDVLGGEVEFETNSQGILGHGDWHGMRAVIDLKTKAESSLSRLRLHGASRRQLWQAHLYGKALRDRGVEVDYVILLFVARDTGNHHAVAYLYDEAIAEEALGWFETARSVKPADDLPRGGRGPKLDVMCDGCQWLTRCWPNDQATILDEAPVRDEAVESALAMHEEASTRETDAKKDKAFATAMVAGEPAGEFGEFKLRHQSSGWRLDQTAAKERLVELGETPPMNPPTYSPRVTRIAPKKAGGGSA